MLVALHVVEDEHSPITRRKLIDAARRQHSGDLVDEDLERIAAAVDVILPSAEAKRIRIETEVAAEICICDAAMP